MWKMVRDAEGHREYHVTFLVQTNNPGDGPANISQTPGLPLPGAWWLFVRQGHIEVDVYAWCRWEATFDQLPASEPGYWWTCAYTFSTRPPMTRGRGAGMPGRGGGSSGGAPGGGSTAECRTTQVSDPLMEPQKISGGYVKYQKEFTVDRNGNPIQTSAKEQITGQLVMFDANQSQIRIEQNVAQLQLPTLEALVNCVNLTPMWGMAKRCVKLSTYSWTKNYQGVCAPYYTRTFDFELKADTFDRDLVDQGIMVRRGKWQKNIASTGYGDYILAPATGGASDYMRYHDWNNNLAVVKLDGYGRPANENIETGTGTAVINTPVGLVHVEVYPERDFTVLGIPLVF